jgi:hypothetical protein
MPDFPASWKSSRDRPTKNSHGLVVVLNTDVAAVGCVGRVPGPGVAERVGQAALGTAVNGCEPTHTNTNNTICSTSVTFGNVD